MNINKLVWTQLSLDDALKPYFDDPSVYLTDDPEEIARRQRELTCLMENPKLAEAFEQLVVRFDELEALRMTTGADAKNSMRILRSIVALKAFQRDLAEMKAVLEQSTEFTQDVELIDRLFENFPEDYSALGSCYEGASLPESMTYRMEVDSMFNIETYRLIAVHGEKYKIPLRAPWASRGYYWLTEKTILVKKPDEAGEMMNPNGKLRQQAMNPYLKEDYVGIIQQGIKDLLLESSKSASNQLSLTARVLLMHADPLQRRTRYFVGALGYIRDLQKVCTVIFPEVCTTGGYIRELSHPRTLLRREYCVPNDVSFDEAGIRLLMGANRGGKTTYLRSVGAAQLLFQMGLPIPAREARMTPVSQVICVFASDERTGFQSGRLGQELNALRDALKAADEHSLVLFNEPLTGTSKKTCETLCREFLSVLKVKGAQGLWVTHLFGMVRDAEAMNRELPGRPIGFLHVLPHGTGGFKVRPGMEEGVDLEAVGSHAREMLEEEGVVL